MLGLPFLQSMGMKKLRPCDTEFPLPFKALAKPPGSIYLQGDRNVLGHPMIAVVGARDVKPWVLEWIENELGPALKSTNVGIVSGGARGVDQACHRLAIRNNLPTLVVLPSGLARIYPQNIQSWSQRQKVLFLTEYENLQAMRKHHFYLRNRLIVALSPLTLVIQAKEKSGTMISAAFAMEQGKTVASLPGVPSDPSFGGNNQLLYDGAAMIRDRKDLEVLINSSFYVKEPSLPAT